jgi:hypothetical protein
MRRTGSASHEPARNEASATAMLHYFFEALLAKHPFTVP